MENKDKIIVALDVPTKEEAFGIVEELGASVGAYKIGMQLYNTCGPEILKEVYARNGKVFLDLKFHDIPNTVASAARVVANLGVFMFNVHASGGYTMMAEAVKALKEESEKLGVEKPLLIAVTVLTSIGGDEWERLGHGEPVNKAVLRLAQLTQEAGL